MTRPVHYWRTTSRAACGVEAPPKSQSTKEIGEVSCGHCRRQIEVAGLQVLGFSLKSARRMAWLNQRESAQRRRHAAQGD